MNGVVIRDNKSVNTAGVTADRELMVTSGNAGTDIAQPTGGVGMLGWLSGIYQQGDTLKILSSEAKPTEGIQKGSMLVEIDTGNVFCFDGTSTWYQW